MSDLDAIVRKAEDAAAKALCRTNCPYSDCKCPRLWRGYIASARNALAAIGYRDAIAKLEAGNADS